MSTLVTKHPRKRRTDGEETRARLLETAGELFAASGYAGTSASSIAERAKVGLSSINYYFGGSEGLYRAVLVEAHRRAIDLADMRHVAAAELSPVDKLARVIDGLVGQAVVREPGWHIHVLGREIMAPPTHIRVLSEPESGVPSKVAIIKQILSDITAIPVDDPTIMRCYISVIAPCTQLVFVARGARGPLDDVRRMPRKAISAHLVMFALAGLEAIGRDHARRKATRCGTSGAAKPALVNRPGRKAE